MAEKKTFYLTTAIAYTSGKLFISIYLSILGKKKVDDLHKIEYNKS